MSIIWIWILIEYGSHIWIQVIIHQNVKAFGPLLSSMWCYCWEICSISFLFFCDNPALVSVKPFRILCIWHSEYHVIVSRYGHNGFTSLIQPLSFLLIWKFVFFCFRKFSLLFLNIFIFSIFTLLCLWLNMMASDRRSQVNYILQNTVPVVLS